MNQSKWICDVTVIDPDTKGEVEVSIFKHECGGMFGIDDSFIDNVLIDSKPSVPDPFNKGVLVKLNF